MTSCSLEWRDQKVDGTDVLQPRLDADRLYFYPIFDLLANIRGAWPALYQGDKMQPEGFYEFLASRAEEH